MKKVIQLIVIVLFISGINSQLLANGSCTVDNNSSASYDCSVAVVGGAYLTFAGKFGGEISQEELASTTELGIEGCARGSRIYAFNLEIKSGGKVKKVKGESYKLTHEVLKTLSELKAGDTFEFKEIKAHLPTGGKIDAIGRVFTVVNLLFKK